MKILLDTNALIWFANGDEKLSPKAIESIENPENEKFVSVASIWEIAIKKSIGKLQFQFDLKDLVDIIEKNGFILLNIVSTHAITVEVLPFIHRDPFDRIIFAQALIEDMKLISVDKIFDGYLSGTSVIRIW